MRHAPMPGPVDALLAGLGSLRPLLDVVIHNELDVIASRLRARQVAALCGFGAHDQARIAAAVSELARNAVAHAGGGRVRFLAATTAASRQLIVAIEDEGQGIPALAGLLARGTGGLAAARRFVDAWGIDSDSRGTRIALVRAFPEPGQAMDDDAIAGAVAHMDALPGNVALSEAHQQNRELTDALATLQAKQDELIGVSARLERTNQEVVALNARLHDKAEALMSADRRKDEFLSVLSHELRGPLSATAMAAQLLEGDADSQHRSVKLGQLVGRQVRHMSRLVEDLLDISRVSRGLVTLDRTPVDVRHVVEAAVEQLEASAAARRHAIVVTLPEHQCLVTGDRTRLLQVVANLLGNAIRYTPERGRIEVAVSIRDAAVAVRVADDGIGIPATLMPHLFDLYTQAERPDGRSGGLGLGLALVKSLVEAHGGSVTVHSVGIGAGSTFEVQLPAMEVVAARSHAAHFVLGGPG